MATLFNINKEKKEKYIFAKPGKYIVFFKNLSGKFIFELKEKGINLDIYGLFVGKNKDQFKVETIQNHLGPGSTSNLLIKGVFYDESKFIYQGLIRIEKEAQKSHAYQKNQNLIMSDECFVDSRPFLEILANDVYCTHGSTTGKLNRDQIYYLQTRMINKKSAENLLIDGFIQEIPEKIKQYGFSIA
ncbi:SufD family Fe-S cluster assembly protein [Candidatus Roizmanbacteria bacterium]|nr:SufD family Fe-S cluster assembly protein [Candidatus Roizmanbacteria bacterium]